MTIGIIKKETTQLHRNVVPVSTSTHRYMYEDRRTDKRSHQRWLRYFIFVALLQDPIWRGPIMKQLQNVKEYI